MKLRIYPETFLSNNKSISNSNNCIICSEVLDKFKEIILNNKDGVLFKISSYNTIFDITSIEYLNCIEFTAPDNSIIVSNKIFESMLLEYIGEMYIDLDIFVPPQASRVVFKINNNDIFSTADIKNYLEKNINKKYKFLKIGQTLQINNYNLFVKELYPCNICLINNTDLEVEFDIVENCNIKSNNEQIQVIENIVNNIEETSEIQRDIYELNQDIHLTREQMRLKRLNFYSKLYL